MQLARKQFLLSWSEPRYCNVQTVLILPCMTGDPYSLWLTVLIYFIKCTLFNTASSAAPQITLCRRLLGWTVASLALEVSISSTRPNFIHQLDLIPQAKSHLQAISHSQIHQIYHYLHAVNEEKTNKNSSSPHTWFLGSLLKACLPRQLGIAMRPI